MTLEIDIRAGCFGVLAFCAGFLLACDDDWAKRLEYGRVVPDFRFQVFLPEPSPKAELFTRFEELALLSGFPKYRGRPISDEMFEPNAKFSTFDWHRDDTGSDLYNISLGWRPSTSERPASVFVIFRNGSLDEFTAQEWLIFSEWKESYLPSVFPDAKIEVTGHPALYTNPTEMLEISRSTGIPIPDDLKERYMKEATGSP